MNLDTIVQADALSFMQTLSDESVNTIVTSPPYWKLRDYNIAGQLGLEPTMAEFVENLMLIFQEARRVLRNDGTCWVNLGDNYAANRGHQVIDNKHKDVGNNGSMVVPPGLKRKDLCGIPWRVVFALQDDGWYLRSDIIWHKPNPMPESVTDRPTKSHEYLFLLTKQPRYWYDADAIREGSKPESLARLNRGVSDNHKNMQIPGQTPHSLHKARANGEGYGTGENGRNKRTVWTVPTQPYAKSHYATYPMALIDPCVKAGCPPQVCVECAAPWERVVELTPEYEKWKALQKERLGTDFHMKRAGLNAIKGKKTGTNSTIVPPKNNTIGWQPTCQCNADTRPGIVLDMFMGAGTTALVAIQNDRHYIGCDLSAEYVDMARQRIAEFNPMQSHETGNGMTQLSLFEER